MNSLYHSESYMVKQPVSVKTAVDTVYGCLTDVTPCVRFFK